MKRAEVRQENGIPALYVDGKKTPPLFYALSDIPASRSYTEQAQKNIKNFARCGINIVCVDTCIHYGWQEGKEYDPSEPLKEIRAAEEANPDAAIIIRLHLNPPYWWMEANRDETYGYYGIEPTDRGSYLDRMIQYDNQTDLRVSLTSEKWLKEAGDILNKFLDILKTDRCGQQVVGIHVACGMYGEWHPWGMFDYDGDYSPSMEKFFRRMLKEKYGTVGNLRAAWHDPEVTFDTAVFPTPEERMTPVDGRYRYPETSMRAIDSFEAIQHAISAAITHFAAIVKNNSPELLVGIFYGYFFNTTWKDRGPHGGMHMDIHKIYADRDIDYISAPFCYTDTRVSGNSYQLRSLLESARLNGKLCLCEMDQHPFGSEKYIGGDPEKLEENVSMLKRNILSGIIHGMGAWYYDHRIIPDGSIFEKNGWWDSPELLDVIEKMTRIAEDAYKKPFKKDIEVLLVCDTDRSYYLTKSEFTYNRTEFEFLDALGKVGTGFDSVYLKDLPKCDLSRYKVVLFMDCVYMDEDIYNYVKNRVIANDRTVIFIGVNGLIRKNYHNIDLYKSLTGGNGTDIIDKKLPHARVIDSPMLIKDSDYLRNIFESAGVHVYSYGGEALDVDNGYVLVHAKDKPVSEIHLKNQIITRKNAPFFTVLLDAESGEELI